jgi:hypothetical protein
MMPYDPTYADRLPLRGGTDPSAAQMGVAPSNVQITGVDDPNMQTLKLIGRPIAQSQEVLFDAVKAATAPEVYLLDKGMDLVKSAVVDQAVKSLNGPPGYVPPPAPNPAPGPTPAPKK